MYTKKGALFRDANDNDFMDGQEEVGIMVIMPSWTNIVTADHYSAAMGPKEIELPSMTDSEDLK